MNKIKDALSVIEADHTAECLFLRGIFTSNHQAYAVLLEEIEEMQDDIAEGLLLVDALWAATKCDAVTIEAVDKAYASLYNGLAEGVQCLSMLKKWRLLLEQTE